MEGFTKTAKMQCFKEGGSVQKQVKDYTRRDRKMVDPDIAQDKKLVKKGVAQHEAALHEGEPKTELKLKCGGRAKKDVGTVKKYKVGGTVENAYGAKKTDKDIKDIANSKRQKPAKLCGGGSMRKYAEGGMIDSLVAAGTKLKENLLGTEEQNKTAQENMDKQAAKGSKLAKFFGGKADTPSAPEKKKHGGKC